MMIVVFAVMITVVGIVATLVVAILIQVGKLEIKMELIIEALIFAENTKYFENDCDSYTMGCNDENCMGDGESCYDDCRIGA